MARRKDIFIDQGSYFEMTIGATNDDGAINLTGYSVRGTIKKHYGATNSVSFSTNIVDANTGSISFSLSSNSLLDIDPGRFVYDGEIISSSNVVTRIVEGVATIRPSISSISSL